MAVKRRHRRSSSASLAVWTVAVLLTGCTAGGPGETASASQTAVPTQTGSATLSGGATQPGAPTPATPAAPSGATPAVPAAPSVAGSQPYQALTAEQQQKVSALEAMDQATFEQQSRDDQLAYGAFLREVYQQEAAASEAVNGQRTAPPAAKKVSRTSSGAEIIEDERLKDLTARTSLQSGQDAPDPAASGGNYAKLAPSRVSPIFATAYAEAATQAGGGQTLLSGLSDPERMRIVDESNNFIPYDGSWEQLEFKVIEVQSSATRARSQLYFAYTPFTDVHGAKDGVWVLMFNAQESQEKWIPDLSVID